MPSGAGPGAAAGLATVGENSFCGSAIAAAFAVESAGGFMFARQDRERDARDDPDHDDGHGDRLAARTGRFRWLLDFTPVILQVAMFRQNSRGRSPHAG